MKNYFTIFCCLTIVMFHNACKKKTSALPSASFTVDITNSKAPTLVKFTNTSKNASTYLWSFGDGTSSTEVNPTHTFSSGGNFNVVLTASDNSSNKSTANNSILITPAPTSFSSEQFIINNMSLPTQLHDTTVFTDNYAYFIVDGTQISKTITARHCTFPITVDMPKMTISPLTSSKIIEVRMHWKYQTSEYDMNMFTITVMPSNMVKQNDPDPYQISNTIQDGSLYSITLNSSWN